MKFLNLLFALAFVFAVSSCGGEATENAGGGDDTEQLDEGNTDADATNDADADATNEGEGEGEADADAETTEGGDDHEGEDHDGHDH